MANEEPDATGKPTAVMPTTSPKAHGPIGTYDILPGNLVLIAGLTCNHLQEPEPGLTNPPSTPHRDDVGNTPQRASASGVRSTATAPQDNSHILIDEAITDAIESASTSATKSQQKSKGTKSKGVVASDRGRKRDDDTITNATGPAIESKDSVKQASRSVPTRNGSNTLPSTKFRPILPKATGPVQPRTVGRGQGNQVLDGPGQSQHDQPISGGHAASESNQRLEEPTISGTSLFLAEPGQIGKLSEDIDLAMCISLHNERLRQMHLAQLRGRLVNQNHWQAQAQGFQELQSAQHRADEAWAQEADNISRLIKKRSELLNKKDD